MTENTEEGVKFINKNFKFWPGGKPKPDSYINILGDNISAIIGWLVAYQLDKIGKERGWYDPHLV